MFHVLPRMENCAIIGRIVLVGMDVTLKDAAFEVYGCDDCFIYYFIGGVFV